MKLLAISCLLALTASSNADGGLGLNGLVYAPGHASADYYAYPAYAFEYAVRDPHTGDNKAQWEKRDGDVVKGAYSLVEPDGSLRVVEYYADDKTGFNAVVKRLGPNLHPTGPVPIYKAPIPVLNSGIHGPLTVGSVAKLDGLAAAPLISGPISAGPLYGAGVLGGLRGDGHGAAISSASLYKAAPIVKTLAPIIAEPIIKQAPIWQEPIIKQVPIWQEPIIKQVPIWQQPIIKSGPILGSSPYLQGPILKSGPILSEGLQGPYLPRPIVKSGPIYDLPYSSWDGGYNRGSLGAPYGASLGDLGQGLLGKGPLVSGWGDPLLGLKH